MRRHSLESEPQKKDTYMNMVPWVHRYLKLKYHDVVTEGLDNIVDGPAMYVANHLAFDDSLAIAAVYANHTGRPLRLGAKSEYFEGRGINNKGLLGKPIKKFVVDTQQIPVYRESDGRGAAKLARDIQLRFRQDESVMLHAEGTRSLDGRLNNFKTGAAYFAIKNSVPVEPVSVTYGPGPISFRKYAIVEFGKPRRPQMYGIELPHPRIIPDGLAHAVAPLIMTQRDKVGRLTHLLEDDVAAMSGQEKSGKFLNPYTKQLED